MQPWVDYNPALHRFGIHRNTSMEVLLSALAFAMGIALPHWLLRWDGRRLTREQRDRGFNDASHWAAVVGFSVLAIPVHFYKTRRTLLGLAQGLVWTALVVGVTSAVLSGVDLLALSWR